MSRKTKRQQPPSRIQNAFIFLLLAIFAMCAIFLTALCAQVYRDTVRVSEDNNTARVIDSVIRGAARSEDIGHAYVTEEGGTETTDEDGVTNREGGIRVLVFENDYDGEIYLRRLFCADGWLRESFTAAEYGFSTEMGDTLVELASFEPEVDGNLLTAKVVTTEGRRQDISVYLWAGGATK